MQNNGPVIAPAAGVWQNRASSLAEKNNNLNSQITDKVYSTKS